MNYKKYLPLLLGTTLSLSLFTSGCSSQQAKTKAQQKNTSITNASTVSANKLSAEELFTNRDKEIGFEESNCTRISLADKKSSCSSSNVSIQEDIITISSEGSYLLSGTLSNGQICINAPEDAKVQLILDDVSISNTNSAAIYVKAADKVFLTLAEDSQNTLRTTDAFGVVALVALTPLIAIQVMGLVYRFKTDRVQKTVVPATGITADSDSIVEF